VVLDAHERAGLEGNLDLLRADRDRASIARDVSDPERADLREPEAEADERRGRRLERRADQSERRPGRSRGVREPSDGRVERVGGLEGKPALSEAAGDPSDEGEPLRPRCRAGERDLEVAGDRLLGTAREPLAACPGGRPQEERTADCRGLLGDQPGDPEPSRCGCRAVDDRGVAPEPGIGRGLECGPVDDRDRGAEHGSDETHAGLDGHDHVNWPHRDHRSWRHPRPVW
jgi:hypothetical protein